MSENMNEKIYLIAAIDCIIGGNTYNKIDLGNYELEYLAGEEERITFIQEEGGVPSLQIQVKLRNKNTESNGIEWVEIYYKSLKKYNYDDLFSLPIQEKKKFIFKAETFVSRKKYATSSFVTPTNFLCELSQQLDTYEYPSTVLPQNLTEEAKKEIIEYLEKLLCELEQELDSPNSLTLK